MKNKSTVLNVILGLICILAVLRIYIFGTGVLTEYKIESFALFSVLLVFLFINNRNRNKKTFHRSPANDIFPNNLGSI